jgi:hypothetical protein
MPRDYKHAVAKNKATPPIGSWVSFMSGLLLGLLVALLAFLYGERVKHLIGWQDAAPAVRSAADREPGTAAEPRPSTTPKATFDFYKILPELEVEIPLWQLDDTPAGRPDEFTPGTYVLQVGSFQNMEEADRVKALLALQGVKASIQRVVINGTDIWYRVNVGPFSARDEINDARTRLAQNGIDAVLLKRINEPD